MAYNRIKEIPESSFDGCDKLSFLDLSGNLINNLTELAFKDLKSIKILYLNRNNLTMSLLSTKVFSHISNIKFLCVDNNIIENSSIVSGKMFETLVNLRYLQLDGYPNASFSPEFSNLRKLQTLVVKGNLMYINDDTFVCFSNGSSISELRISSNLIDVTRKSFSHFHNLKTLNLNDNDRLGFPNISKSLYGLENTQINALYLVRSVPYDYEFITLDESFTKGLYNTQIKKIILDSNNILVVDAKFRLYTPHLEYISFEYNRLVQTALLICDLYYLKNLTYFSAASQNKRLPDDTSDLEKYSHFVQNRAEGMPNVEDVMSSMNDLNDTCDDSNFNFGDVTSIPVPHNLEYLNLSGTLTESVETLKMVILLGKPISLKYVNYASNGLHVFEGPLIVASEPPELITLDYSDNNCYHIGPDFFKYMNNVIGVLYLNYNRLGEQFIEDKNITIFQNLTKLTELHLAFNIIKSIPQFTFINQVSLSVLNLSHNSLQFLDFDMDQMVNLSYLDVSANLLTQLDQHYTNNLNSISTYRYFTINLKDNPLACSCESLHFLRWIMYTYVTIDHWKNYTCTYNRKLKYIGDIENMVNDLAIECYSNQWLVISSVTFCCVALIVAIIFVLYRHKFEIKVCCLKLTYQWKYEYQQSRYYKYDAFIAFHENDLDFVREELVSNLERNNEFKLCIHHRNFTVGASIEENILAGIEKSRKTVVILSENFLKSSWCDFEYEMARVRGFDEGVDIIVPIIKGELSSVNNMSRSIRALLKKNTYIQWPEHQNQVEEFWDKIKTALRGPRLQEQSDDSSTTELI